MTKPFFSIVIATYNRASTLRRALDSAFNQNPTVPYEVLVVDDGSTDDTPRILNSYGDRIRVIRQSNAGPAIARNRAIAEACGQYLCFLDSDDYWFPWTLETYREVIEENHSPSFLVAAIHETSEDKIDREAPAPAPLRFQSSPCYYDHLTAFFMIGCPMMIVKRDILLSVGSFPELRMNCEDSDLCLRLGESPGFVRIDSPATVAYVRHEESLTFQGLDKTVIGVRYMLSSERAGDYPGGADRSAVRAMLLSTHARSASVGLLKAGKIRDGWALYRESFRFHLKSRRWKYLVSFPVFALLKVLR